MSNTIRELLKLDDNPQIKDLRPMLIDHEIIKLFDSVLSTIGNGFVSMDQNNALIDLADMNQDTEQDVIELLIGDILCNARRSYIQYSAI